MQEVRRSPFTQSPIESDAARRAVGAIGEVASDSTSFGPQGTLTFSELPVRVASVDVSLEEDTILAFR